MPLVTIAAMLPNGRFPNAGARVEVAPNHGHSTRKLP
jgi:hypothetical protein